MAITKQQNRSALGRYLSCVSDDRQHAILMIRTLNILGGRMKQITLMFVCTVILTLVGTVNASSLYIADSVSGNIYTLNKKLEFSVYATKVGTPLNIHFNSKGILHFWDHSKNALFSYSDGKKTKILEMISTHTITDYAFDSNDNIYLTEINSRTLFKYDYSGAFISQVNHANIGLAIVIDSANQVYIGGVGDHKIHIYDENLQKQPYTISGGNSNLSPRQIGPDGEIFATSGNDGKVLKHTTRRLTIPIIEEIWWPRDVAVDSLGSIYVAAAFPGNQIQQSTLGISIFDSDGNFKTKIGDGFLIEPNSIELGPTHAPTPEPPSQLLLSVVLLGL